MASPRSIKVQLCNFAEAFLKVLFFVKSSIISSFELL